MSLTQTQVELEEMVQLSVPSLAVSFTFERSGFFSVLLTRHHGSSQRVRKQQHGERVWTLSTHRDPSASMQSLNFSRKK